MHSKQRMKQYGDDPDRTNITRCKMIGMNREQIWLLTWLEPSVRLLAGALSLQVSLRV